MFPALAAVIAIWGLIADPAAVEAEMTLFVDALPPQIYNLLWGQLSHLLNSAPSTLGWTTAVSLAVALWSARSGVSALMRGMNAIYETPHRNGIQHAVVALLLTMVLVAVSLLALSAVVIAPIAVGFLPLGTLSSIAAEISRWVVGILSLVFGLSMLYRYGPNRSRVDAAWLPPGAVLVIAIWWVASLAFSYYLTNFAAYNKIYGSIGAVIALLMWLYISALLVLLGATINRALERGRQQKRTAADPEVSEQDDVPAGLA